jgi:hypothetical protein
VVPAGFLFPLAAVRGLHLDLARNDHGPATAQGHATRRSTLADKLPVAPINSHAKSMAAHNAAMAPEGNARD